MHAREQPLFVRVRGPLALGGLTVTLAVALSAVGLPSGVPAAFGPVTVLSAALSAGLVALAYVLGGFGLARPIVAIFAPDSPHRHWYQLVLGLGIMFWISHLAGMLGVLSGLGMLPRIVGWGIVAIGLAVLLDQVVRPGGSLRPERWVIMPFSAVCYAPALALLLVAACNPPGSLWRSEFGAFDALSYHLQLPKEWAASAEGRVWPVDHNVYSFLPSLVESGYMHLGAMMPGPSDPVERMLGGEAMWVLAAQLLHALCAMIAGLVCGRLGAACAERMGAPGPICVTLGVLSGALVMCTPWMIVVGSLAYNEAPLLALFAAAALVAMDVRITPGRRAMLAGALVGLACGCKPTALLFAGPMVGVLLFMHAPGRTKAWVFTAILGSLGGLLAILPWLVRNAIASGNPVFPFAAGVLGRGRWTSEQVARYAANHHAPPGVTLGDRVARLFSAEFGLRHEQYAILLVVMALGLAGALAWKRSRTLALAAASSAILQGVCWMAFTHMQSRFLITMLVPTAMLCALAGAGLIAWVSRGRSPQGARGVVAATMIVLAFAPLSQAGRAVMIFLAEDSGSPNRLLVFGPGSLTGSTFAGELARVDDAARRELIDRLPSIEAYVNLVPAPQNSTGEGVFMLGDSTPLYVLGATGGWSGPRPAPVIYHTTWDASPLGAAMSDHPNDPQAWSIALRRLGVRHVLVNFDELTRFITRDHYYDPRVTMQNLRAWLTSPAAGLRNEHEWPNPSAGPGSFSGRAMFRIDLEPDAAAGGPATP